jgi:hypothetical protein
MLETLLQKVPAGVAENRGGAFDWAVLTLGAALLSVALIGAITGVPERAEIVPVVSAANL